MVFDVHKTLHSHLHTVRMDGRSHFNDCKREKISNPNIFIRSILLFDCSSNKNYYFRTIWQNYAIVLRSARICDSDSKHYLTIVCSRSLLQLNVIYSSEIFGDIAIRNLINPPLVEKLFLRYFHRCLNNHLRLPILHDDFEKTICIDYRWNWMWHFAFRSK